MAVHYSRKHLRRNLLEMYRDNALRSQSYMDTVRLNNFMQYMTLIETTRFEQVRALTDRLEQLNLFDVAPRD